MPPSAAKRLYHVGKTVSKHTVSYFFYDLLLKRNGKALPSRLTAILEELGPIFIKFGQAVSTRPELLPGTFLLELQRLQDQVTTFPTEQAVQIIKEDLGASPHTLFRDFQTEPVASASLAQVHKAKLNSGKTVAIKVRRPGLEQNLSADISLLYRLAGAVERIASTARKIRMTEAVEEFEKTITQELDFLSERKNIEKFRRKIPNNWELKVPLTYSDYSSSRVLTLEWLDGIKVDHREKLIEAGFDPRQLALRIGQVYLKQIIELGIFHSDPHPGNIFILPDGKIGLVDFGTMGNLSGPERKKVGLLLVGAARKDSEQLAQLLADMNIIQQNQVPSIQNELARLIGHYYKERLEEIKMGRLLYEILSRIVRRYEIELPPGYLHLSRTAIVLENICEKLDSNYRWPQVIKKTYPEELISKYISKYGLDQLKESIDLVLNFPRRVDKILTTLEKSNLDSPTQDELETLINRFAPPGQQIALGFVIGTLIISTTLLMLNGFHYASMASFGLAVLGVLTMTINYFRR